MQMKFVKSLIFLRPLCFESSVSAVQYKYISALVWSTLGLTLAYSSTMWSLNFSVILIFLMSMPKLHMTAQRFPWTEEQNGRSIRALLRSWVLTSCQMFPEASIRNETDDVESPTRFGPEERRSTLCGWLQSKASPSRAPPSSALWFPFSTSFSAHLRLPLPCPWPRTWMARPRPPSLT